MKNVTPTLSRIYFLELRNYVSKMARHYQRFRKAYQFLAYLIFMFIFLLQQISAQAACCNILTNGNFESGNTEFTSGLPQNCACASNSYCIGTNFQVKCPGWNNLQDHTTGSGNFLIVDGNPGSPVDVWRKSGPIVASLSYCFSFWVASEYDTPFQLGVTVDNISVPGSIFTIQQADPVWTQYSVNFTNISGNVIAIRQLSGGAQRDFGLDDIEFGSQLIPNFNFTANTSCGMNFSFFNQSTGPAPLTYLWDFDDPNSASNFSTLANPTHDFTDCGTYSVCLTVTRGICSEKICKTIVAKDIIPPKAKCLGVGVVLDANCMGTVTPALIDNNSSDNCGIQSMSVQPSILSGCGFFPVTLIVTDLCGNTSTCIADVQTTETNPPVIVCPANISVNATPPSCSIIVNGIKWISATDDCSIPTINYVVTGATQTAGIKDASGISFEAGVSTVTYTATDACGNTSSCSFTVTVGCRLESCTCPGGALSPNLILNGEFTSGNAGFTSGMPFNPNCGANSCYVLPNFNSKCSNWPPNFYDHTYGPGPNPASNFLVVDGNEFVPSDVWRQNVNIVDNMIYCFSFYVANVYTNSFPLEVKITDGITSYNLFASNPVISSTAWTNYQTTWACPAGFGGNRQLTIRQVTAGEKRDFGIDDICFTAMDTCACGNYDFLYAISRGPFLPYDCGDTLFVPSSGSTYPIQFLPTFKCLGSNCTQTYVDWILTGPPGSGFIPISMNNVTANPGYNIPISNATFTHAGIYTLTITGYCDNKPCPPCVLYFTADGYNCCGLFQDFCQSIMTNVSLSLDHGNCKAALNIINLPNCVNIQNINWGDGTTSNGPFNSASMPMHIYSSSGIYIINYSAIDFNLMANMICNQKIFTDTIHMYCCDDNICKTNLVKNPGFLQGAISGDLGNPGVSNFWQTASASPQIVLSDSCCDPVSVQMWGHANAGESICQPFVFLPGHQYSIKFCARFVNLTSYPNVQFEFMATTGCINPFSCTSSNCTSMGSSAPITSTSWQTIYLPDWIAPANASTYTHLNIRAFSNQILETPFGRIDEICIEDKGLVLTKNIESSDLINIFPNPTNDVLNIEFLLPKKDDMRIYLSDFTGRIFTEKQIKTTQRILSLELYNLPSGLYFLQVISNGKLLAVEKIIKQ